MIAGAVMCASVKPVKKIYIKNSFAIYCQFWTSPDHIPLHSEKSSTNLVAIVGCHGIMVTMTMVSGSLLLYVSKGIIVFPLLNAAVFI